MPGREDTELIVRLLSSTGVVAVHGLLMPVERELVSHINARGPRRPNRPQAPRKPLLRKVVFLRVGDAEPLSKIERE